ncbi:DUF1330 domain-containing protein [uncultured Massilia sp.]|uniref:DUF1330 domain-containing protein n=1 Tax=uncultured Massilia sp. TaxID=169973 RepID=UPI00258FC90A|nr:DUF1330 domain-containing protein [uncultured Massilia sp.]
MTAYAVGLLKDINMGPDIVQYLKRIDATLAPYRGRFLLHGEKPEVLEGSLEQDVVVIEFPDLDHARAWYRSPAYHDILPLRTRNATSTVFLVDGLPADHLATDILA